MIPFPIPGGSMPDAPESLTRVGEAPAGDSLPDVPAGVGRVGQESAAFSAVLLAIASLGSAPPVEAAPVGSSLPGPGGVEGVGLAEESQGAVDEALGDVGEEIPNETPDLTEEGVLMIAFPDTVTLDRGMLRNLRGDFVARLERVAERMWNEHGLRVDIVEGYRTPQRQRQLYEQGRTTDGPIVTWTTNSLHSRGAAADLMIDGAPIAPQQAVLLARVAREEGLRTLYPFDSGHIQLDGISRSVELERQIPRRPDSGPATASPRVQPGVAPVAPVARTARPPRPGGMAMAELEGVSRPDATVSDVRSASTNALPAVPRLTGPGRLSEPTSSPAAGSNSRAGEPGDRSAGERRVDTRPTSPPTTSSLPVRGEAAATQASSEAGAQRSNSQRAGPAAAVQSESAPARDAIATDAARSDKAASRGEHQDNSSTARASQAEPMPAIALGRGAAGVRAGVDSGPATTQPLTPTTHFTQLEGEQGVVYRRIHLPIEGVAGSASLQLGIRGGAVDASLLVADAELAESLQRNLYELRQVLASRGIEAGTLAVKLTGDAPAVSSVQGDVPTTTVADGNTTGSSSDSMRRHNTRERDRPAPDEQQQRSPRDREEEGNV